jgi:hypothetical protein
MDGHGIDTSGQGRSSATAKGHSTNNGVTHSEESKMADPVNGESRDAAVAAVKGENMKGGDGVTGVSNGGNGNGVHGISATGFGLLGESRSGRGVVARSETDYGLRAASRTSAGIRGSSVEGRGVEGWATDSEGVVGISTNGTGVWGQTEGAGIGTAGSSKRGSGVRGTSIDGRGVDGESTNAYGVAGFSQKSAGVRGTSVDGRGVEGWSTKSEGVVGISTNSTGVWGQAEGAGTGVLGTSVGGRAVHGISQTGEGMHGQTNSLTAHAVVGFNHAAAGTGAAVYAEKKGDKGHAGFFVGNVHVTKVLSVDEDIVLTRADCAEDFDIADVASVEPGTVMVLGNEEALHQSYQPYDKRVAGVISGAGEYRPGIVLDKRQSQRERKPLALLGKVYCKVDARYGSIEVGDLLTTSASPGHAMKASDPLRAFGAVIGKALRSLPEGQGLIPILVSLQ